MGETYYKQIIAAQCVKSYDRSVSKALCSTMRKDATSQRPREGFRKRQSLGYMFKDKEDFVKPRTLQRVRARRGGMIWEIGIDIYTLLCIK